MRKAGVAIVIATWLVWGCSSEADVLSGAGTVPPVTVDGDAATPASSSGTKPPPPPPTGDAGTKDSGGPSPITPPVGNGAQDICVNEINKWRATEGLPPLQRWQTAETCSDGQCKSDSETNRAHGAFGQCTENAQNECPGWPGKPETMIQGCLKMMWDEKFGTGEKGHYVNMKSTAFTKVACGFYVTPAGKVWAVQNFRP